MRKPNEQGFYALEAAIVVMENELRAGVPMAGLKPISILQEIQLNFYGCYSESTADGSKIPMPPVPIDTPIQTGNFYNQVYKSPKEREQMPEKPEDKEYSENWGKDFRDEDKGCPILLPGDFCKCSILDDRIVRVQKVVENGVVVEWTDKGLPMVQRVHFEHLEKVH